MFFLVIGLIGFVSFLLLDFFYPMPEVEKNKKFSQLVVDKNGRPLRAFADKDGVWRYPTQYSKVSPNYISALVNYEDRLYWQHSGVNPFSLFRALGQFIVNGRAISGGSTITMQVARIMQPHSKTIPGKLWQMFRAFQLEFHLDKKQIIELYFNYAPFGGPIEGIEAATYTYLGKSASELTDAEAALMAVLPQSPSRFRPDRYPKRAQKARDKVIDRLGKYKVWSGKQVDSAKQEMVFAEFNSRPMIAPLLSRRLMKKHPQLEIIKTTIDIELQQQVSELVKAYLSRFSDSTSASALLIDNKSMDVLSYVGAGDFANPKRFGHVDMIQAIRSPGSTLKPFIYAMALDKQLIHSESLLQDVPLHFGQYSPQNFTRNFSGPVSVSQALQQSLNIPAVQLLSHLGAADFSGQIENSGAKLYFPEKRKPSLSLALGGAGITLEDLTILYRSIVVDGLTGQLRYLQQDKLQQSYLMSKESAWIVADILSKFPLESNRISSYRTHATQNSNRWVAHKTGTSYGHRDALVIAVTTEHTLAVWIGKPDGTPSPGEFGRKTAAPLANKIIELIPQAFNLRNKPELVENKTVCWPLGTLFSDKNKEECLQKKQAWIIDGAAPTTLAETSGENKKSTSDNGVLNGDLESWKPVPIEIFIEPKTNKRVFLSCYIGKVVRRSVVLYPPRLDLWLPDEFRYQNLMPEIHPKCEDKLDSNKRLIIVGVDDGARVSSPPNLKEAFSLSLSVSAGKGVISWLNNGELIGQSQVGQSFTLSNLKKGQHYLVVYDTQGNMGSLSFEVL